MKNKNELKKELYFPEDEKLIDYKLDEFRKKNKITKNYFKNNIEGYIKHFNINIEEIKNGDEDTNYNIPFLAEPIMGIMFRNFKLNPLVDGRRNKNNISIDKLIEYNKKILEDIDQLPTDMKYNIKKTSTYEFNYILNEVIPIILDKMSILFSMIISNSSVSAGNSYIELIDSLDSWIINFINQSIDREESYRDKGDNEHLELNIDNLGNFNTEKNGTYIIDKILKDEYIGNINKVEILKEKLKKVGKDNLFEFIGYKENKIKQGSKKKIDKNYIDREKLIKWINDEKSLSINNYEELLIDRERYLIDLKRSLNLDAYGYNHEGEIKQYRRVIEYTVSNLAEHHKGYLEKLNVIDSILASDCLYDIHTKILYNKVKTVISSQEYTLAIENGFNDTDIIQNKYNVFLDKVAKDMMEEYNRYLYEENKLLYERNKKVKSILEDKNKEFMEKNSQLNLIRSYLSKAMGQTITPILLDEITKLSKVND